MRILLLILFLIASTPAFAQEQVENFDDRSLPVLNEELRKQASETSRVETSIPEISNNTRRLMWFVASDLQTGTEQSARLFAPVTGTLVKAVAYVKTAPTGADLIIDINKNGTTLWASGKLTVAASANTGSKTTFDSTAVTAEDYFTIDIDQIGSTVAGSNLTVMLTIAEEAELESTE